jgi:hypothetical protein
VLTHFTFTHSQKHDIISDFVLGLHRLLSLSRATASDPDRRHTSSNMAYPSFTIIR